MNNTQQILIEIAKDAIRAVGNDVSATIDRRYQSMLALMDFIRQTSVVVFSIEGPRPDNERASTHYGWRCGDDPNSIEPGGRNSDTDEPPDAVPMCIQNLLASVTPEDCEYEVVVESIQCIAQKVFGLKGGKP
jgi:hypothetical protein